MTFDESIDLLIGSANIGKVTEIRRGLIGLPIRIHSLTETKNLSPPEEVGRTYHENALLKARYYQSQTGFWTLADDSGLEVDALGGQPGVLTARFGGAELTDRERLLYLLAKLGNTSNRRARFVSVIAIVGPEFETAVSGQCVGTLAFEPRGINGFGYDPIFVPNNYAQTFAEMPDAVKGEISHRGKAILAARKAMATHFSWDF
jgi:XTP/dITP diphosphohydrolase